MPATQSAVRKTLRPLTIGATLLVSLAGVAGGQLTPVPAEGSERVTAVPAPGWAREPGRAVGGSRSMALGMMLD